MRCVSYVGVLVSLYIFFEFKGLAFICAMFNPVKFPPQDQFPRQKYVQDTQLSDVAIEKYYHISKPYG